MKKIQYDTFNLPANANIGEADSIYTFPYYCAFLLRRYLKTR